MSNPIHPKIYIFLENDYNKLFDIIHIYHNGINNLRPFSRSWLYWIRNINVDISISPRGKNQFEIYDKFSFSYKDRVEYNIFQNYNPVFLSETSSYFHLFPLNFLCKNLSYLFKFEDNIDYRINIEIDFEDLENILSKNWPINLEKSLFFVDFSQIDSNIILCKN